MQLYVVGGQQREQRPLSAGDDWYEYQKGLVLKVDTDTGDGVTAHEYVSPPDVGPDDNATILFKSGSIRGNELYLCTQTEIIVLTVPTFARVAYISLPMFNDVHHVLPTGQGTLLVANTGLDTVLEITLQGEVLRLWNVLGQDPWARFSPSIDYRKVRTTKPHLAHPNHVFLVEDQFWVTRFEQRDAICLTEPGRRIDIGLERVHDGLYHEGLVYFTTVDGQLVIADPRQCKVIEVVDLKLMHPGDAQRGWCRGVFVSGSTVWVGFSRIRPTKFRENVGWVLHGFKRDVGTHIAGYDLQSRTCVSEVLVEPFGLSAVFGIFPAVGESELGDGQVVES